MVIFSYGIGNVSAASGDTVYVNGSGGNDLSDGSSWLLAKKTIRNATGIVNDNGTVNIANGQYTGYSNCNIVINRNMTINGQSSINTILNGTGTNWIFHINNGTNVILTNMTFANTASNSAVSNYGNLDITCCYFINNNATSGGAVNNYGNLNITNCNFINNNATDGGAIFNDGNLNITGSNFTNNSASHWGGSIVNLVNCNITSNNLINNSAVNGGAIYTTLSGVSNVHFNRIFGNTAILGSSIYNNNGGSSDASLNWWGSNSVSGMTYGNVNIFPYLVLRIIPNPYAILNNGNTTLTIDLNHDQMGNDHSAQGNIPDGIPITFKGTLGTISNEDITISNGIATSIFKAGSKLGLATITATVDNETASTSLTIGNFDIFVSPHGDDNTGDGSELNPFSTITKGLETIYPGGTIHISNGNYEEDNILISNDMNIVGENQQNTFILGSGQNYIFNIPMGVNVKITNLTLLGGDGAIVNDGNLIVNNCSFTANTAVNNGGAICMNNGNLYVTGSSFTSNTATYGGAIWVNNGNLILHFNRFFGNTANYGNNIYNENGNVDASLNWWGSNTNPADDQLSIWNGNGYVNVNPWIVLTGTANPYILPNNYLSTVVVDLLHDSNGYMHDMEYGYIPYDGEQVFFNTTLGTLSNLSPSLEGSAETILNSGSVSGVANISASYENQNLQIPVIIIDSIPPTASATPNGGIYNSKLVTLTMSEFGTIYYTTDGTIPNYYSNRYSYPLQITTNTTLKYVALDLAGNLSPIYTQTYTIDNIPPVVTANKSSGFYNSTQNVTLTTNKPGTIYYTTNGNIPDNNSIIYTGPLLIETNTILKFFATDLLGNLSQVYTENYTIDTLPPIVNVNTIGGLYNNTKLISLNMTEPGIIYYTLNGTTPTTSSTKYTKTISITNTTVLNYFAIDLAGNKSPIYTQKYSIDNIPPKISSTTPNNLKTNLSRSATIVIKFTENIKSGTYFNKINIKNLTTGKYLTITKTISGNTLSIKTSTKTANTWYLVTIPKSAIKDVAGNNLAANYTFKFETRT